jgi:hypothetical protein
MKLIQAFLIAGLSGLLFLYLQFFRTVLFDRFILIALFSAAVVCVLAPDRTSDIAHLLGVGRGTDLLLYILFLVSGFCFVMLYTKVATLSLVQTEMARSIALSGAREPKND